MEGLKLPSLNHVLRWNRYERARATKRMRAQVVACAAHDDPAMMNAVALPNARVTITVWGPYTCDRDNVYTKDVLDAIVARLERQKSTGIQYRRWGLILDDGQRAVHLRVHLRKAPTYSVVILVE